MARQSNIPYDPATYTKRSGCKAGTTEGTHWVTGWRLLPDGGGLQSIIASPLKSAKHGGGRVYKSQSGDEYLRYVVKVKNHAHLTETLVNGLWSPTRRKLYIPDFNLVASPGGNFFGRIRKR